jgi:RHS repeat-associated protein
MTIPRPPYYPPFGSSLPNRTWNDGNRGYRFGFNGKEKDSETANDNYDFGARMYDGRLGRWLSLDPLMKKYIDFTPYNFAINSPIYYIDVNGMDIIAGIGWHGSAYENIYNLLVSQKNPVIDVMNQLFTGLCSYNITFEYNGTHDVFKKTLNQKTKHNTNEKGGQTNLVQENNCSILISMNPNYCPEDLFTKRTDKFTKEMDLKSGSKDHYFKYKINTVGQTFNLLHEMIHAKLFAEGILPDDNIHHIEMASTNSSARLLLLNSLKSANTANNWGLTSDQIEKLSYAGTTGTDDFKLYIAKSAKLDNIDWFEFKNSKDSKEKETYETNIKLWKNAYDEWHETINNVKYDKVYFDKNGKKIEIKK